MARLPSSRGIACDPWTLCSAKSICSCLERCSICPCLERCSIYPCLERCSICQSILQFPFLTSQLKTDSSPARTLPLSHRGAPAAFPFQAMSFGHGQSEFLLLSSVAWSFPCAAHHLEAQATGLLIQHRATSPASAT